MHGGGDEFPSNSQSHARVVWALNTPAAPSGLDNVALTTSISCSSGSVSGLRPICLATRAKTSGSRSRYAGWPATSSPKTSWAIAEFNLPYRSQAGSAAPSLVLIWAILAALHQMSSCRGLGGLPEALTLRMGLEAVGSRSSPCPPPIKAGEG